MYPLQAACAGWCRVALHYDKRMMCSLVMVSLLLRMRSASA
jgi:hypothetical protein